MDGTDFRILEPSPFDPKWYSHKFKGAGVRYEVGICLKTGWIVWWNGAFPCGAWPDLRIARDWLVQELLPNEKVIADGGYNDSGCYFVTPTGRNDYQDKMMADARARHETVNNLLKHYNILKEKYRGDLDGHHKVFGAVVNLVQMKIENGEAKVFQIEVEDD